MSHPLTEVGSVFLRLGSISFGGPIAHLGYFRAEIVEKRGWLTESDYADLVALCQMLPGPASSQVVFALGMRRAGLPGALLASLCFMLPSTVLLIAFGYGITGMDLSESGWLHGLRLAAVAVVAQAVWGMGSKLCRDLPRRLIAVGTAILLTVFPGAVAQIVLLLAGAGIGRLIFRRSQDTTGPVPRTGTRGAIGVLTACVLILGVAPALAIASGNLWLESFDRFYRAGALVFGGGHVVLPMLRAEVVPAGWVTDDQFMAGYGAAQAIPGPLFCFASFLGTSIQQDDAPRWSMGVWCLLSIMLPAWLLIWGALPLWDRLRTRSAIRSAMDGANAAVVGILLAALWNPVIQEGVRSWADVAAAVGAFLLLEQLRASPVIVVIVLVAMGRWLLP